MPKKIHIQITPSAGTDSQEVKAESVEVLKENPDVERVISAVGMFGKIEERDFKTERQLEKE